jgi:hypothetical protein
VEVHLARALRLEGALPRQHRHPLDGLHAVHGLVHDRLQRHRLAAAEADVAGDDHPGPGVPEAAAQRGVAEAGVHDRVDGADAGAGEHGHDARGRQGQVDDHAVAR